MKATNYLVTWNDLATMGIPAKSTAPTGLGIANKAEIINSYFVDENASPFSTYTSQRCPPYQTIVPITPIGKAIGAGGFDSGIFGIYTSINYGLNWSLLKQIDPYSSLVPIDTLTFNVAASLTFQYITYYHCYKNLINDVIYFDLYKSSDYGTTWTKITSSVYDGGSDLAMSDDGLYQILTTYSSVYRSLDYGVTWTQISGLPTEYYRSVAISYNGQYQTFIATSNLVYTSSNFGASFNITSLPILLSSTAMSKDGKYQYVVGLELFKSTNYGASFAKISSTQNWDQCAVSQTGQYVLLSRTAGYGYVNQIVKSSDFGVSYSYLSSLPTDTYIVTLSVSPDGRYQLLGGQDLPGGYPYTNNVIFRSSDFGNNFPQIANTNIGWGSLGMGMPVYTPIYYYYRYELDAYCNAFNATLYYSYNIYANGYWNIDGTVYELTAEPAAYTTLQITSATAASCTPIPTTTTTTTIPATLTDVIFDVCTSPNADGSGELLVYVYAIKVLDSTPIAVDTNVTVSVRIEGGETGTHTQDFTIFSGNSCTQSNIGGFNSSEPITTGDVLSITPTSSSTQAYSTGTVTISYGCISCF